MNIMIFVAGAVVGALAAFTFIFICMAVISKKDNKPSPLDEHIVKELWKDYLKETQDDGK